MCTCSTRGSTYGTYGDGDSGASGIHARARNFEETRREGAPKTRFGVLSRDLSPRGRPRFSCARDFAVIAKNRGYSQSKFVEARRSLVPASLVTMPSSCFHGFEEARSQEISRLFGPNYSKISGRQFNLCNLIRQEKTNHGH